MPLNWLGNLQYYNQQDVDLKSEAIRNTRLQNDTIEQKNALIDMLNSGGGAGAGNALEKLAVVDPQSANALLKVRETTSPTPYSGEGFQNQLARVQYQAYIDAGYAPNEAARLAGSDVMQMKQEVYTDQMGNQHMLKSDPLPDIAPRERALLDEVLAAPKRQRNEIYKKNLKLAQDEGIDTSGMPEDLSPEWEDAIEQLFGRPAEPGTGGGPVELVAPGGGEPDAMSSPKVRLAEAEERTKLSEQRRGKIIDEAFAASERTVAINQTAESIKANLDGLVESGGSTGPASGVITFLNDLGQQMGIPTKLNESSALTQIEGFSNELAIPLVKQLGVNPTDKDFGIVKSTVARAGTSVPANYAFLYTLQQVSERQNRLSALVEASDAAGNNEKQMKARIRAFNEKNHIVEPKPFPADKRNLKKGETYATERGIEMFDGTRLVRIY